jgi:hypothetical protein
LFVGFDAGRSAIFSQDVDDRSSPMHPRKFAESEGESSAETFDISPDGKTLVTAEQELQASIYSLDNVPGVKKTRPKGD